jgi:hypothetical protein
MNPHTPERNIMRLYINAENPYGTDAFAPVPSNPIARAPREKKVGGRRGLPAPKPLTHYIKTALLTW